MTDLFKVKAKFFIICVCLYRSFCWRKQMAKAWRVLHLMKQHVTFLHSSQGKYLLAAHFLHLNKGIEVGRGSCTLPQLWGKVNWFNDNRWRRVEDDVTSRKDRTNGASLSNSLPRYCSGVIACNFFRNSKMIPLWQKGKAEHCCSHSKLQIVVVSDQILAMASGVIIFFYRCFFTQFISFFRFFRRGFGHSFSSECH